MGLNPALAKKIAQASAAGGGNWIKKHGRYRFVVEKIWEKNGFKGNSFIINFRVVTSEKIVPTVEPHAVGESLSVSYNMDKNASAFNLIKRFLLDLTGEDEATGGAAKEAQEQDLVMLLTGYQDAQGAQQSAITDSEQPLKGKWIDVETFDKTTQKGQDIIATNWKFVKQDDGSIASERARLEALPVEERATA